MAATYVCPDGYELRGTAETVPGIALAVPVLKNGAIVPDYDGETAVSWDDQVTLREDGEDLWICDRGDSHKVSTLVLADEEDE